MWKFKVHKVIETDTTNFTFAIYGREHYWWTLKPSVWFYRPCEHSSGGVGFKVPGVHVCFMWGMG